MPTPDQSITTQVARKAMSCSGKTEAELQLNERGIFRVPQMLYQQFMTSAIHHPGEVGKIYVRNKLLQYINSRFPGAALANFAEVKVGCHYEMYIQLLSNGTTVFAPVDDIALEVKELTQSI
jgi:hypothetical protein